MATEFLELTQSPGHDAEVLPRVLVRVPADYPLVIQTAARGGSVLDLGHMELVVEEGPDQIVRQIQMIEQNHRLGLSPNEGWVSPKAWDSATQAPKA